MLFRSGPVRLRENRFEFVSGEIADDAADALLEWDVEDALRHRGGCWFLTRNVHTKRADGREAGVAGRHRIASVLFEEFEEAQNRIGAEVVRGQLRDLPAGRLRDVDQQEAEPGPPS